MLCLFLKLTGGNISVTGASTSKLRLLLNFVASADARQSDQITRSIFLKDMTRLNGQRMDANVVVLGTDNVGKSGKFFLNYILSYTSIK